MSELDKIRLLRRKVRQMWEIAGANVTGGYVSALMAVYNDIQRLFDELEDNPQEEIHQPLNRK